MLTLLLSISLIPYTAKKPVFVFAIHSKRRYYTFSTHRLRATHYSSATFTRDECKLVVYTCWLWSSWETRLLNCRFLCNNCCRTLSTRLLGNVGGDTFIWFNITFSLYVRLNDVRYSLNSMSGFRCTYTACKAFDKGM